MLDIKQQLFFSNQAMRFDTPDTALGVENGQKECFIPNVKVRNHSVTFL